MYLDLTIPEQKTWLKYNSDGKIVIDDFTKPQKHWEVEPTPKEGLYICPKVAQYKSPKDIIDEIPYKWIKEHEHIYGTLTRPSLIDPVSNLNWDYLWFKDSSIFSPAANLFKKSRKSVSGTNIKPYYCRHLPGTRAYVEFWEEEYRRIMFGYEPLVDGIPCGLRISGEFYFYLNYSPIDLISVTEDGKEDSRHDLPDFLAMDYYYFKELEARENPQYYDLPREFKKSMTIAKSRRKGFSYKCQSGCVWIIAFNKGARVAIASAPGVNKTDAALTAKKCQIRIIWNCSIC